MDRRRVAWSAGIAAALAGGLVLRLWFIHHAASIAGDTLIYGAIAKNWLQQGIYGIFPTATSVKPTLIRLPGYPLFLAVCFRLFGMENYTAVLYVQLAIDLASCLLLGSLVRRLLGPRAGMAALWLAALCPFSSCYVAAPLTETLTLFCIVAAFDSLHRWHTAGAGWNRWLVPLGVSLAYSILLRPEQGLLAASIVPAMLWMVRRTTLSRTAWMRAAAPVLVLCFGVLSPLLPWTIRNWRTFHVFQPLAPRSAADPGELVPVGFNRWYRSWAIDFASTVDVYWNYDTNQIDINDLPDRAFDSDEQYARTDALLAQYNRKTTATPALDRRFAALAEQRIAADPLRYDVELPLARLADMILRPRTAMLPVPLEWWRWSLHPAKTAFAFAYAALNLAYLLLAATGLFLWRRRGLGASAPLVAAMLATILLRCVVLLTLDNSETRYTLEFFPVLIVLASATFARTTGSPSSCDRPS